MKESKNVENDEEIMKEKENFIFVSSNVIQRSYENNYKSS